MWAKAQWRIGWTIVACRLPATGLACGCGGWRWQLQDLLQQQMSSNTSFTKQQPAQVPGQQQQQQAVAQSALAAVVEVAQQQLQQRMIVCIIDNRGVGLSSSPADMAAYSTKHMAQDVLAVMVSRKRHSCPCERHQQQLMLPVLCQLQRLQCSSCILHTRVNNE